jgi:hypothetical protein
MLKSSMQPDVFEVSFPVGPSAMTPPPSPPQIDFCKDVRPLLQPCASVVCHLSGPTAAAGLALFSSDNGVLAQSVQLTAIGRPSIEANSGPLSAPAPPLKEFLQDMPIIDPGQNMTGDPGHSYLLYKLLMAMPGGASSIAPLPPVYSFTPTVLSEPERETLASLIPGREMPLAISGMSMPNAGFGLDDLERFNFWIAQGPSPVPVCP